MINFRSFLAFQLSILALTCAGASARESGREALLAFFLHLSAEVSVPAISPSDGPSEAVAKLPKLVSPPEHQPYLEACEALTTASADPELTRALLNYVLVYRDPANTLPAKVLGRLFLEQTDTLVAEYEKLSALQRVVLFPYIKFGFQKATDGKLKAGRKYRMAKQALDRLHGRMMNARVYDAMREARP